MKLRTKPTLRRVVFVFFAGYFGAFFAARTVAVKYSSKYPRPLPKAPATAPRVLEPDAHGVAYAARTECQNSTYTLKDVTVRIISSVRTFHSRFPAIRDTWVQEFESRGARVLAFVGPGEGDFSDPRVVRVPRDNDGGCGGPPTGHCDLIFREHAATLAGLAATRLVAYCDDDTLYDADAFERVLRCMPENELWMLGDCGKAPWEARSFCGGGSSYVFHSSILKFKSDCHSADGRADDVANSWCAMDAGATLVNHPGFSPRPGRPDGWVTAHAVKPEDVPYYYDSSATCSPLIESSSSLVEPGS
jgi:hypothetical protein